MNAVNKHVIILFFYIHLFRNFGQTFQFNKVLNSFTKTFGVFVNKPKKVLIISKGEIIVKNKDKTSLFRSIDAVVSGQLSAYVFCKIILGFGSTQMNSWNESINWIKWAIKHKLKDTLICLIDTDDIIMFNKLKKSVSLHNNIKVFSHIHFQEWVEKNTK